MISEIGHSYTIAVDLGATNVRVALIATSGHIIAKIAEPTLKKGGDGIVVTRQIIRMIRNVRGSHPAKIQGIGIASIGPLDYRRGGPLHSPNAPFAFIPLVSPLQSAFRVPISLLNDCNAAVLAEQRFGAGKGIKNLVYITISTGIGAGVIANGKLLLGKSGNAAEVGHFNIAGEPQGLPCSCGKGTNHWEGYASGENIPRFFRWWLRKQGRKEKRSVPLDGMLRAEDLFCAARAKGDPQAKRFLDALARINAHAISTIIAAYDPELITIGGSVALANKNIILEGIKKYVDKFLEVPIIKITPLGEDITLLGAAAAIDKMR